MKKFLLALAMILSTTFAVQAFSAPISIKNDFTYFGQFSENIILEPDEKGVLNWSDIEWKNDIQNAMAKKAYIGNDLFHKPLYQWEDSLQFPWAAVGYKIFLSDEAGNAGPYLGHLSFTLRANPADKAGTLTAIIFSSNGSDPQYAFQQGPSVDYIPGPSPSYKIRGKLIYSRDAIPPIITNAGWTSGMRNAEPSFISEKSFWAQDYGMDEVGRWTVDSATGAIRQSTAKIAGNNMGSRAYPLIKDANGKYKAGEGVAFEGVWQIDIKIGSNGAGPFCETFYLSERANFAPGPSNYMDGSGQALGGYGREIDIMETRFKHDGPQVNLVAGGGTSWNPLVYQSQKMANWSEVGGAPTPQFITFGALIKNKQLWLYAYKPDGTLWYSTEAIPLNNTSYQQRNPFVPYIGTWGSQSTSHFYTQYKNFIYVSPDKIANLTPDDDDNGRAFFNAVKNAR